jgi:hypothetical protein
MVSLTVLSLRGCNIRIAPMDLSREDPDAILDGELGNLLSEVNAMNSILHSLCEKSVCCVGCEAHRH